MQCEPHIVQFFSKVGLFPNKRNYEVFMFHYFNATAFMFYYFNATACGALLILDLGPRSWNIATTLSLMGDEFLSLHYSISKSIHFLLSQSDDNSSLSEYGFLSFLQIYIHHSVLLLDEEFSLHYPNTVGSGTIHKQALYPSPKIALKTWKALSKLWTWLTFQKDKSKAVDK